MRHLIHPEGGAPQPVSPVELARHLERPTRRRRRSLLTRLRSFMRR
jgi:hypothetical protein